MSGITYIALGILITLIFLKRKEIFEEIKKTKLKSDPKEHAISSFLHIIFNPISMMALLALSFAFFMKMIT